MRKTIKHNRCTVFCLLAENFARSRASGNFMPKNRNKTLSSIGLFLLNSVFECSQNESSDSAFKGEFVYCMLALSVSEKQSGFA